MASKKLVSQEELIDDLVFPIITSVGEGRGLIFEAFENVRAGKYSEADRLRKEADQQLKQAHSYHHKIVNISVSDEKFVVPLILVHAEDQLMSVLMEKGLLEKISEMQKEINELKALVSSKSSS